MTISFKILYAIFALQLLVGGSISSFIVHNCKYLPYRTWLKFYLLGTSRYSAVYGLINSSMCALIMLSAFVTDNEAKKFFRRKIKNLQEKMSMKRNQVAAVQFQAFRGFEANDIYVIDI